MEIRLPFHRCLWDAAGPSVVPTRTVGASYTGAVSATGAQPGVQGWSSANPDLLESHRQMLCRPPICSRVHAQTPEAACEPPGYQITSRQGYQISVLPS